jgi:hypothetical protein
MLRVFLSSQIATTLHPRVLDDTTPAKTSILPDYHV